MTLGHAQALMVGLPNSGKTTFLAAFYHVVESGGISSALHLVRYPPVREYLEQIRSDWLALVPQTRTQIDVTDQNMMELSSQGGTPSFELFFPDVVGDSFRALMEERTCTTKFRDLISSADRILLFIHPDYVKESVTISERDKLAAQIDGGEIEEERPTEGARAKAEPWGAAIISTQVKLVDLLQIIRDFNPTLTRLAIVISAWDRVETIFDDPESWVRTRLPLLWQFLISNRQELEHRVFGVSALGGNLGDGRSALEAMISPLDRPRVVGVDNGYERRDITFPIRWLIS